MHPMQPVPEAASMFPSVLHHEVFCAAVLTSLQLRVTDVVTR
jgi:hypothetical protein